MKGVFIVIEGIDGAGKGYAMMRLQEYIMGKSKKYDHLLLTREPTNSLDGQKIREILATERDSTKSARKCIELFIKDRTQHFQNYIKPALDKGYVVLCDRFKYSTMAFQAAQGISLQELIDAQAHLPAPDLALFLDLPAKQAVARIRYRDWRGSNEKFENTEFLEKVRNNYLEIARQLKSDQIVVINAGEQKEDMFNQIRAAVEKSGVLPY